MMLGDRKQVIAFIEANGAAWTSTVTSATTVLVIHPNELSPPTSKVASALRLGKPIVTERWLVDSVALRRPLAFTAYAVKKRSFAALLGPVGSVVDKITEIGADVLRDVMRALVFVLAFVLSVPLRVVPLALAMHRAEPYQRTFAFYRNQFLLATHDWIIVALLAAAVWLAIFLDVVNALPLWAWPLLALSAAIGVVHLRGEVTNLNSIFDPLRLPVLLPVVWVLAFAALCTVMGPVIVIHKIAKRSEVREAFARLGAFLRSAGNAARPAFDKLSWVLLYATAIPLRILFIVKTLPVRSRWHPDEFFRLHLVSNIVDWLVVGALYTNGAVVLAHVSAFVDSLPPAVLWGAAVWCSVGAVVAFWHPKLEHLRDEGFFILPASFLVAFVVFASSVLWLAALPRWLFEGPLQALERALEAANDWIVQPVKRALAPLARVAAPLGRALATAWSALVVALVVLLIVVTIYRIPALIQAFRERTEAQTIADVVFRAVEREAAFFQSASEQRANRWRAVAERKRLIKAKAARAELEDDEDDDGGDDAPVRRSRGASRSPSRSKGKSASRSASKSPARR